MSITHTHRLIRTLHDHDHLTSDAAQALADSTHVATCSKALLTEFCQSETEALAWAAHADRQYPVGIHDAESPAQVYTTEQYVCLMAGNLLPSTARLELPIFVVSGGEIEEATWGGLLIEFNSDALIHLSKFDALNGAGMQAAVDARGDELVCRFTSNPLTLVEGAEVPLDPLGADWVRIATCADGRVRYLDDPRAEAIVDAWIADLEERSDPIFVRRDHAEQYLAERLKEAGDSPSP